MKITEVLASPAINPALKLQLEGHQDDPYVEDCFLASPEISVVAACRYDYSDGGGVARYSLLHVLYKDEVQVREWQYCDKYSHSKDRRDLMILKIGGKGTKAKEEGDSITVVVECVPPKEYSPRFVTFKFKRKADDAIVAHIKLPEDEQEGFDKWVRQEGKRKLNQMLKIWNGNTHTMPTPHGRVRYRQPRITSVEVNKPIGVAIIITEEQIDCDTLGNTQMQQKALLLMWKGKTVKVVHEEHAYLTVGSANIDVVGISPKAVTLGTQSGQKSVP